MANKDVNTAGDGLSARMRTWLLAHCSGYMRGIIVAVLVGLLTGLAAFVLKWMIGTTSHLLTAHFGKNHGNWQLLVLPVTGIVLVGIFQRIVLKQNIEHGVEMVEDCLRHRRYNLRSRMIYSPMIASTLTLGFGGSAGSEGPIATTGAAIGSAVGRWQGMSPALMRIMIGCGAGAGIAGIFKAPLGGMLFTLEVLQLELTTLSVLTLLVSCLVSALTAYALSGFTYDINVIHQGVFDPAMMPYVLVFSVLCGAYSAYYCGLMSSTRKRLEGVGRPFVRNLLSGGMLAVVLFLFPTLYGEGYDSLTKLLDGDGEILTNSSLFFAYGADPWVLIVVAACILACKPAAAGATTSGGGVAGDFAPTLFAGAMMGYLFAMTLNTVFGTSLSIPEFSYIGMAAVMAGAVRAPLMAIFLVAEMTDSYQFLLPLLIAGVISYCVMRFVCKIN